MRAVLFVLLIVTSLLAGQAEHARGAEDGVHDGRYVRVTGSVGARALSVAGDLGDALFLALERDLGRAPPKEERPLELHLYPDRASFQKGIHAAGYRATAGTAHDVMGGWTRWKPCTSYVWTQADAFDTRRLILHELVHQFYARCREPARRGTGAAWYREGLAEWYGWHRFTPTGVRFGAFDAITRNARIAEVKRRVADSSWSAYAIASGARPADYTDSIALVGALRGLPKAPAKSTLRELFAAFEKSVLTKGGGVATFKAMPTSPSSMDAYVRGFWRRHHVRWRPLGPGWDEDAGILLAKTKGLTVLRDYRDARESKPSRSAPRRTRLDVTIRPAPKTSAGVFVSGAKNGDAGWLVSLEDGALTIGPVTGLLAAAAGAKPALASFGRTVDARLPAGRVHELVVLVTPDALQCVVFTDDTATELAMPWPSGVDPARIDLGVAALVVRHGSARFEGFRVASPRPKTLK